MRRSRLFLLSIFAAAVLAVPAWSQGSAQTKAPATRATPDLTKDPTLYMVGYAHLDTQWRWTYPQVIREMLPKTLHENFRYFGLYPDYIFNFSGANRYRLIKEYYPADYEKMKEYIAAGRWIPCGSSMEECDVNVPAAESIIRQVLYGNHFFRREFGIASNEFMLPDCFGFPASLPSLLGHCGVKGFSTQKLTWGSAVGIPFHVGVWEGLDGTELVCALDAGNYNGDIKDDLSNDPKWLKRIDEDGKQTGVYADYNYYGVGDEGGAPREDSVKWLEKSVKGDGPVHVISARADQMFLDIPADHISRLPRYKGDLLLTEHSAGSITSAAYMKRWNRKSELLADAAERASVLAAWLGGPTYPQKRLNDAWTLVMGGQFHDILPGTSHPQAYEYSWNDEILAQNQFASVLTNAVGAIASGLDTRATGVPLVVYNPLSFERQDVVEARVKFPGETPDAVVVVGPGGSAAPGQILGIDNHALRIAFLATAPSTGFAVYDVRPAQTLTAPSSALKVTESSLENARYRIKLDDNGDVASIFDKAAGRELLSSPARLAFLHDVPRHWPAWNVDWTDRQKAPEGYVDGPATVRIVESGPVRVALEVTREARGSRFVQTVRLSAGEAGNRVEFANTIDWQSTECSLKAVFPLTVSNPAATYNWEVGTIQRGNNDPKKYEVPAHEWFDLTDTNGDYGVTVLTGCKYGSDKPDDDTLRLTLLRTPGTHGEYQDQGTQDWGRHEILYGLAGHTGDWRSWTEGRDRTDDHALRLQQPLIAFQTDAHAGAGPRSVALLKVDSPNVRVMAVKKAEDSDETIIRLVETTGEPQKNVSIRFAEPLTAAREVNGQEQPVGDAQLAHGALVADFPGYRLRTFAVRFGAAPLNVAKAESRPVKLPFDRCVTSADGAKTTGGIDSDGRCLPAAMLPEEITYRDIAFKLGPIGDGRADAVTCRGQSIPLPQGDFNRLYLLATAGNGDRKATFSIDGHPVELNIEDWGGYIGQWDARIWEGNIEETAFPWPNKLVGLRPAYIRPAPVAWYCSHRHAPDGSNEPYEYCYLFAYALPLPAGAKTLTLPHDEHVFILAAAAAKDVGADTHPAQPLLDELKRGDPPLPTFAPAPGQFTDSTLITLQRPLFGGGSPLHYTLDGSDPQADSPTYTAPFLLNKDTTVKARLIDQMGRSGPVATATFRINDTTPPTVLAATSVSFSPEIRVDFSEPLDQRSAETAANYALSGGQSVQSAALAPNGHSVTLTLAAPPAGAKLELSIHGVRDLSPAGNAVTKTIDVPCLRPIAQVDERTADGAGGGYTELPLGDDAPTAAQAPFTINVWLWVDKQPEDLSVIAGFGNFRGATGSQRYIAKFPHGLHFWGSNVDISANTPLDVRQWQMLTATFDGEVVRLFKNGKELVAEGAGLAEAAPVVRLAPPPPWSYGHRLTGKIAGFTLWNQALSPASVAALHDLGHEAAIQ